MALYPEAQRKAHEELDRVVGVKQMPGMEHFTQLPYLRGILKETLRCKKVGTQKISLTQPGMPTAIAGAIPHRARATDEFEGHIIPAGATIVLAVWACNNDAALFEDPREFKPERHDPNLTEIEAALSADPHDRDHWTFGAGRRLCPGLHVAERTLFLSMARILWAFDIKKAKDEKGNEIPIDRDAVTQSIAACPLPFR